MGIDILVCKPSPKQVIISKETMKGAGQVDRHLHARFPSFLLHISVPFTNHHHKYPANREERCHTSNELPGIEPGAIHFKSASLTIRPRGLVKKDVSKLLAWSFLQLRGRFYRPIVDLALECLMATTREPRCKGSNETTPRALIGQIK
ncbi:hypothetical protein TNCV_2598841 [Trichonephila clavipes]|nr:hypothetical protein TNCV_2598841 [Trichonephila clavipes]